MLSNEEVSTNIHIGNIHPKVCLELEISHIQLTFELMRCV